MGAIVLTKDEEEIKCPLVMVANNYGVIVMKNVALRGMCENGSPVVQKQGQQPGSPTTEALIIEKDFGWRIVEQTEKHTKKKDKK